MILEPTAEEKALVRWLLDAGPAAEASLWRWLEATPLDKNSQAINQLLPCIYLALRHAHPMPQLARIYRGEWVRNQQTLHAALGAARLLGGQGIPAAPAGALALALAHDRDPGARVMPVAELAVPAPDLSRADQLLRGAGWRRTASAASDDAPEYRFGEGAGLTLRAPLGPRFWERCSEQVVRGERVLVPDLTCRFLLACLQGGAGASHLRARWILDAGAILQSAGDGLDWGALAGLARDAGTLPAVRDALRFLRQEVGLAIPAEALGPHLELPAEEPAATRAARPGRHGKEETVCLVGILKNEEPFIEEWIAYHRLIGVDHFILFDDDPALPLAPLLAHHAPYVSVVPWAGRRQRSGRRLPQLDAYLHALELLPSTCAWVTFIDGDEFIVLRQHASLAAFLDPFEGIGQVTLQWLVFGHNGSFENPPRVLITASLTRRRAEPSQRTKVFARPEAIADLFSPHLCTLRPGWKTTAASGRSSSPLLDIDSTRFAHINHYQCRSFSNWMARVARGDVNFQSTSVTADTRWRLDEAACLRAFVAFTRDANEHVDEHMLRFQAPILAAMARARSSSR